MEEKKLRLKNDIFDISNFKYFIEKVKMKAKKEVFDDIVKGFKFGECKMLDFEFLDTLKKKHLGNQKEGE